MATKRPMLLMADAITKLITNARQMHRCGKPSLSAEERDRMIQAVRWANPSHPSLAQSPWGWKVAHARHPYGYVGEVSETYRSICEALEPDPRGNCVITPKFDGVPVVCYYKRGVLLNCVTRGDGFKGVDVTNNVISRIPLVIRPFAHIKEQFTGYIQCKAAVNFKRLNRRFPKTAVIRNAVREILHNEADAPMWFSYLGIVPVNVYHADEQKFVKIGSGGWLMCTRGFKDKPKHLVTAADLSADDMKRAVTGLAGQFLWDGVVVRAYGGDRALKKIFKIPLKTSDGIVETVVTDVLWDTVQHGRLHPIINCAPVSLGDGLVCAFSGRSYRVIAGNRISAGAKINIFQRKYGCIAIHNVVHGANPFYIDARCKYGCDPEMVEIDYMHAYCRNPRCPGTAKAMLCNLFNVFAHKRLCKATREKIMGYFRNDIFSFLDYYKDMRAVNEFSAILDGVDGMTDEHWTQFKQMLIKMLRWELALHELIYIAGIERLSGKPSNAIIKKASSGRELTEWAKETATLPKDWGIEPKAAVNWARRHYLVRELLRYFKLNKELRV